MFARNINPFVPNAPFLYLLKTENFTVFWCFHEIERGCIVNKWVNFADLKLVRNFHFKMEY